ncbi:hypothetical protein ScPMuIL_002646 [Solemya velum]
MNATLIKVLCVVVSVAMVVSVPGPAECRQRYKTCLSRGKSGDYCERMKYKCVHVYCVYRSNHLKRKSSVVVLLSCLARHEVPTLLWDELFGN